MERFYSALLAAGLLLASLPAHSQEALNTLPRYGGVTKTRELRKLDQQFVDYSVKQYHNDRRAASEGSVAQGWSYLYDSDLATSMKRFNQAWLIDSTNYNVYYGFSALLSEQGDAAGAHRYFKLAQRYDKQKRGVNKFYERLTLYYQSRKPASTSPNRNVAA